MLFLESIAPYARQMLEYQIDNLDHAFMLHSYCS